MAVGRGLPLKMRRDSRIITHTRAQFFRPQIPGFWVFEICQCYPGFWIRGTWVGSPTIRDVRKPNFGSVSVYKNPNRTEAKRSNPKFRFPRFFSKPN